MNIAPTEQLRPSSGSENTAAEPSALLYERLENLQKAIEQRQYSGLAMAHPSFSANPS